MLGDKILLLEIDPLVEEETKVAVEEIIIIGVTVDPIIEIDQEEDGTTIGQVIESGNYPHYNRRGNTRPHHRQNTQWTFRNRSQSRSRNENYGIDHFRGRSRDRNQRRQEES